MNARTGILLVDYNRRNVELLSSFLREAGFATHGVSSMEEFDRTLEALTGEVDVSLSLVDLTGFDASIWERCRRLHEAGVAFVVIARPQTAEAHRSLSRRSHGAGASHTLTKPLRKEQLLTLVRILTGTDDEPA